MTEDEMVAATHQALAGQGVQDPVLAVGIFHPRGFLAAGTIGGLAGSVVGGAIGGDVGDAVGIAVGVPMGLAHASDVTGQPRFTFIAVTKDQIYGLRGEREDGTVEPGALLWSVDRAHASISVHSRISMRVFEIEDVRTGHKLSFEATRGPGFRSSFVIHALHDDPATT